MNREEQEAAYREAMRARRAGEVCPLCGKHHGALEACFDTTTPLPPQARTSDVETSHMAAATDKRIIRLRALDAYMAAGTRGLVDDDIAAACGQAQHESYRRRGSDLRALCWTEWQMKYDAAADEIKPVRRRTTLGASARVSVITPLGRRVWEQYGGDLARPA